MKLTCKRQGGLWFLWIETKEALKVYYSSNLSEIFTVLKSYWTSQYEQLSFY